MIKLTFKTNEALSTNANPAGNRRQRL
jgi:hypothetical protein